MGCVLFILFAAMWFCMLLNVGDFLVASLLTVVAFVAIFLFVLMFYDKK